MYSIDFIKSLSSLSSNQPLINLSKIKVIFFGTPKNEPWPAGWDARMLPLCYAAPYRWLAIFKFFVPH